MKSEFERLRLEDLPVTSNDAKRIMDLTRALKAAETFIDSYCVCRASAVKGAALDIIRKTLGTA